MLTLSEQEDWGGIKGKDKRGTIQLFWSIQFLKCTFNTTNWLKKNFF